MPCVSEGAADICMGQTRQFLLHFEECTVTPGREFVFEAVPYVGLFDVEDDFPDVTK